MNGKTGDVREFGGFRLDVARQVLWFDEKPVNLPLKEIELLCVLTDHGGEVVTKSEIMDRLWADSFVEESNLSRHIYLLRKTFKDLGKTDLIETVPRRGYRFAGDVSVVDTDDLVFERLTTSRTWIEQHESDNGGTGPSIAKYRLPVTVAVLIGLICGAGFLGFRNWQAAVSPAPIRSLAVLPFTNIGDDTGNIHFGMGATDILVTRLSNIRELIVRPTSAVMKFENQDTDSISFGKQLAVDAVLEGTIYRTDEKVRVTARLIRVSDGSAIWSGQLEKLAKDELRIQDELSFQVVDALALNLSRGEKNALGKQYTESTDAYLLYQKGRYEWNKRSDSGMVEAQRLFRNAIERDPNFALAYVGLADTLGTASQWAATEDAIHKALEIDPLLAEAHASLGFVRMFHDWKWAEAERSFQRSIELNPNYATAHHWYAELLAIRGDNAKAKTEMRRAIEINPASHNFLADLGQIYYFNREYKEAEEHCLKALEIYPEFSMAYEYLMNIYLKTGEYDKAAAAKIMAGISFSNYANESAERKRGMEAGIEKQKKVYREEGIKAFIAGRLSETDDPSGNYYFAVSYAFLGDREKTLTSLERSYEGRGFLSAFIKAEPMFDDIRNEPRYREILRKMDLEI